MTTQTDPVPPPSALPREGRDLSLWAAVLGAPVLWLSHLQVSYMLVPWTCATGRRWVLHAVSAGFLALTLAGGWLAWREFKRAGNGPSSPELDAPLGRSRLLSAIGLMSAGLFALAIFAQALASFFLDPCAD
jgi:hypothetical protein